MDKAGIFTCKQTTPFQFTRLGGRLKDIQRQLLRVMISEVISKIPKLV